MGHFKIVCVNDQWRTWSLPLPKHALRDYSKDKIGAQVMTEVSASLVLRFVVKSPRQSYISKGFISYWLLIDTKILIRQAGE